MGTRIYAVAALLLACALSACSPPDASASAPAQVAASVPAPVQVEAAEQIVPAIIEVRAAIQAALPAPVAEVIEQADPGPAINATSVALIVRWEVGSPQRYARLYQGIECPPGSSGPTIGIGADLGTQTPQAIRADWSDHPDVEFLEAASGQTGKTLCNNYRASMPPIQTPYPLAELVFKTRMLPAYSAETRRAYGAGTATLAEPAVASLESMDYNRGPSMAGDRNREKRHIRDVCVPAQDADCIAAQLRSMKRLWPDIRGLRDRREDEARTAEGA